MTVVDDPDTVGENVGLLEVLGSQEDRDVVFTCEPGDLVPKRGAALDVEAGCRLVEKENARAMHESHREIEPALHPARVAADLPVGRVRQSDAGNQLVGTLVAFAARERLQRCLQAKMLTSGQQRVERGLLEGGADRGTHVRALGDDVVARHSCHTRGGRQQRCQHVDGRRLAGAVRSEEAVDLPRSDREVDSVNGPRAVLEISYQPDCLDCVIAHRRKSLSKCLRLSNNYWFK